ncbi:putative ADP-ribosylation factor GTPase-activating protein AGD5 [Porphyridium purpureum]|uniref:Putative ADP-ribosylation factor GTPase-activating protein AGD5 n=1 Tax=Porphyridium purpureum TaxID=35688 RepID=A0A5J4YLH9_PORPP|nr:putative ADP-ribosylation factor GTPase-activating protein AGD5 [Porphyridium purpureum]|eukprot:POR5144..scf291_13
MKALVFTMDMDFTHWHCVQDTEARLGVTGCRGAMATKKDARLNDEHQKILRHLLAQPENRACADCLQATPRWASTNLGVFLCIACSGLHRKMGTHISVVRSIMLDTWTPEQIELIQRRGNAWAKQKFEGNLPANFRRPDPQKDPAGMERFIRDKYEKRMYMSKGPSPAAPPPKELTQKVAPHGAGPTQPPQQTPMMNKSYERRSGLSSLGTSVQQSPFDASAAQGVPAPAVPAAPTSGPTSKQRAAVVIKLTGMGFTAAQAIVAIEHAGTDLESCVAWLLDNPNPGQPASLPTGGAVATNSLQQDPFASFLPAASGPGTRAASSSADQTSSQPTPPAKQAAMDDWADFGAFESASAPAPTAAAAPSDMLAMMGALGVAASSSPTPVQPQQHQQQQLQQQKQQAPPDLVQKYSNLPERPPVPLSAVISTNGNSDDPLHSAHVSGPDPFATPAAPEMQNPPSAQPEKKDPLADLFADLDPLGKKS